MRLNVRAAVVVCALSFLATTLPAQKLQKYSLNLGDTNADLVYTPLSPCRIIDTRTFGGPITGGTSRAFKVAGTTGFDLQGGAAGGCGVPVGATASLINFVAVAPDGVGNLKGAAYPNPIPTTGSIINYQLLNPALNIANAVAFPICDPSVNTCSADIVLFANGGGTQVVADVLGYFRRFPKEQTITSIVPGTGLTGGGTSGALVLGIDVSTAATGQALMYNGTSTTWALPPQGTITGVTAGTGLTGGGTSGSISLAANLTPAGGINGSATTVARGDHKHYVSTVIVSPVGTDPVANGTALVAAFTAIAPPPSAASPTLLKIEPGVYDLGTQSLGLPSNLDVEGSGEDVTTIKSSAFATLFAPAVGEIRFLTVQNTGSGTVAIYGYDSSASLTHVTGIATPSSGNGFMFYFAGVGNSSPRLQDVTANCTGSGCIAISFYPSSATGVIKGTVRRATVNLTCTGGGVGCVAVQDTYGSTFDADSLDMNLSSSLTSTALFVSSLGTTPGPTLNLRNFTLAITQTGTNPETGVFANGATTSLRDGSVTLVQSATNTATGISSNGDLRMTNCSVVVSGGTINIGVAATGGTVAHKTIIESSRVNAATNTVAGSGANMTIQISNSKLEGGPVASGTIAAQCLANIDENFAMFASTCP